MIRCNEWLFLLADGRSTIARVDRIKATPRYLIILSPLGTETHHFNRADIHAMVRLDTVAYVSARERA